MSKKRKTAFDHMVAAPDIRLGGEKPATNKVYLFTDKQGYVVTLSTTSTFPTRDDLIKAYEMTPPHVPVGKDDLGWVMYDVRPYSRAEIEEKVDRFLRSLT